MTENGDDTDDAVGRRQLLKYTGAIGLGGVAGCLDDEEPETDPTTGTDTAEMEPDTDSPTDGDTPTETDEDTQTDMDAQAGEGPTWEETLFAAWRGHDPTEVVTLQWLTGGNRPDPTPVELTANGSTAASVETEVAAFGDSPHYRERADVMGLEPDTEYAVHVDGSDTGWSVRTAPVELDEPLVFAEGGDIGVGTNVRLLHGQAAEWDPLFGFVGGDLAYANAENHEKWVGYLRLWHEHMRSGDRLIPQVAAIGNHEILGGGGFEPIENAQFFYSLFDNPHREHAYFALDIGEDVSLVILDSEHTTRAPGAQTEWLEETLAERQDRQHLMVAYHVPMFPSAKPFDARNREAMTGIWTPLFEEYDVDIAFEHDDHTYSRTHRLRGCNVFEDVNCEDHEDGILYVGDGAWGAGPRDVKSPEERPYLYKSASELHVIQVTLSPDGSREYRAVGPRGATIDRFDGEGNTLEIEDTPTPIPRVEGLGVTRNEQPQGTGPHELDVESAISRSDGTTTYEAILPWEELPVDETADSLAVSLLVNDNDGDSRIGWVEWGGGIGSGKDPSQFKPATLGSEGEGYTIGEYEPTIDGSVDGGDVPSPTIDLDEEGRTMPEDANPTVGGRAWVAATDGGLYLAGAIDDDTHHQEASILQLWRGDSMQFGVATGTDADSFEEFTLGGNPQ